MAQSTPKSYLETSLTRFSRFLDYFSIDDPEPEFSTSAEENHTGEKSNEKKDNKEGTDNKTTGLMSTNQETHQTTEPEIENQIDGNIETGDIQQTPEKPETDVVQLRHGRRYFKTNSDQGKDDHANNKSQPTTNTRTEIEKKEIEETKGIESKKMANITLVNNVLQNNIPILMGEDSPRKQNEVYEFISCARLGYETLSDAQDKALFIKLLPTRLRGRALEVVQARVNETLEDIFNTLKSNLIQNTSYITLNTQLRNVQQLPMETLLGYFNRVKTLINACKNAAEQQYANGGEGLKIEIEEVGLHCFKLGITNANYKFYLLQDCDNNLEALGRKIARLEQTEQCMQQSSTYQQMTSQQPATPGLHTMSQPESRFQNQITREPRTFGQNQQQPQYQSARNYTGYSGYQAMPRNTVENNTYTPRERQDKRQIRCHFCGRPGHVIAECRTKQMTPFCTMCKTYGHSTQNCNNQRQRNHTYGATNDHRKRQVNHTTAALPTEECNFCLENGHTENKCFLKERWERLQLEKQTKTSFSENCEVTIDHTASRH